MVSSCFLAVIYSLCRRRSPPFHFLCSPSPSSIIAGEHHLHCSSSGRFERAESFATSMRSTLTRSRRPISSKSSASRLLPRGRPSWPSSSPPLWPAYSGCSRYCLSLVLRLPLCRDARKQVGCSSYQQGTSRLPAAVLLRRRAAGLRGQAVTGHLRPSCGHPRARLATPSLYHPFNCRLRASAGRKSRLSGVLCSENRDQGLRLQIRDL